VIGKWVTRQRLEVYDFHVPTTTRLDPDMKSVIPIVLLLVALIVLATLQYQWIGQISLVERQKMESSLVTSSRKFVQDFTAERERTYGALETRYSYSGDVPTLIARHREWAQTARYPNLVKTLYVADTEASDSMRLRLRQISIEQEVAEPVPWPGDLTNLAMTLEHELDPPRGRSGPNPFRYRPKPGDAMVLVIAMKGSPSSQEGRPALRPATRAMGAHDPGATRPNGWVIARLESTVMTKEILPALADRHFSRDDGQSYRLAVVDTDDNMNQVYTTSGPWSSADLEKYDYAIDLLGYSGFQPLLRQGTVNTRSEVAGSERGRGREIAGIAPASLGGSTGARGLSSSGFSRPSVVSWQQLDAPLGHHWRLLVKNEAGSLEAAVGQLRQRNLGVDAGIGKTSYGVRRRRLTRVEDATCRYPVSSLQSAQRRGSRSSECRTVWRDRSERGAAPVDDGRAAHGVCGDAVGPTQL
jgi:hypothetical protein